VHVAVDTSNGVVVSLAAVIIETRELARQLGLFWLPRLLRDLVFRHDAGWPRARRVGAAEFSHFRGGERAVI
jgi:hypothetical protein